MIVNIWGILTVGFFLGASAGFTPGPMLVLIISETLRHGLRAGAKVAFIPLITDIPLLLLSGFFFSKLSNFDFLIGSTSLAGSMFLLYLGIKSFRISSTEAQNFSTQKLLLKELIVANFFNPNPYLFWLTVGAPLMVSSFNQNLISGTSFLFSFYFGLVGSKFLLAIITRKSSSFLQGSWYRLIMQLLSLILIGFSFFLLKDGLNLLGLLIKV